MKEVTVGEEEARPLLQVAVFAINEIVYEMLVGNKGGARELKGALLV